ncbi:MAG: glycosyltransferase family 4 protein [Leptospiraceae bacterium]|nr:glycosyltransferase family 4 protein [Leptospiraceae bacterium]
MPLPIAIYCTSYAKGGLEMNVVRLGKWLHEMGYPVAMLVPTHSAIGRKSLMENIPVIDPGTRLFAGTFRLLKILKQHSFRILVVHRSPDLRRAVLARLLAANNVKLVFMQHMQFGVPKRDFLHTWFFRKLSAWIVPLRYLAKQVVQMTRYPQQGIVEIPFGIEVRHFTKKLPNKKQAQRSLGLPTNAIIAGTIGRFDPLKNQAMLLRAAAPLITQGMPLHLLLVGENTHDSKNDYGSYLRELARELGIEHAVHFRPFQEDVRSAYAALDIFVLTSQSETFGMVTVEAMACGLPVIATRSGGTPELVSEKSGGLLFTLDSEEELRAALKLLATSPNLRKRLGVRARKYALNRFSHKKYTRQLIQLFHKIDCNPIPQTNC